MIASSGVAPERHVDEMARFPENVRIVCHFASHSLAQCPLSAMFLCHINLLIRNRGRRGRYTVERISGQYDHSHGASMVLCAGMIWINPSNTSTTYGSKWVPALCLM